MLKSIINGLPEQSAAQEGQLIMLHASNGTPAGKMQAPVGNKNLPIVVLATLPATPSADTMGKLYFIGPDSNGYYQQYITVMDDSVEPATYAWQPLGPTAPNITAASEADCRAIVTDYVESNS